MIRYWKQCLTQVKPRNLAWLIKQPDKKLVLIEIKTSCNARYNMREALGKLLDYANWEAAFDIEGLIIVSPSAITAELKPYFLRLKKSLKYRLSCWQYSRENDKTEKFIKY